MANHKKSRDNFSPASVITIYFLLDISFARYIFLCLFHARSSPSFQEKPRRKEEEFAVCIGHAWIYILNVPLDFFLYLSLPLPHFSEFAWVTLYSRRIYSRLNLYMLHSTPRVPRHWWTSRPSDIRGIMSNFVSLYSRGFPTCDSEWCNRVLWNLPSVNIDTLN